LRIWRGIADDQFEVPLKHSADRAPVDARALHADMAHAFGCQPIAQRLQFMCHCAEAAHLAPRWLASFMVQDAGDHGCLMHIKPGTLFDPGNRVREYVTNH
jgi:hypothetical protein